MRRWVTFHTLGTYINGRPEICYAVLFGAQVTFLAAY